MTTQLEISLNRDVALSALTRFFNDIENLWLGLHAGVGQNASKGRIEDVNRAVAKSVASVNAKITQTANKYRLKNRPVKITVGKKYCSVTNKIVLVKADY